MESNLKNRVVRYLVGKINMYLNKEGAELQKIEYGMEVLIINISKISIIYMLAVLCGTLWQTLVIHSAFVFIKKYSFGLHALNSTACTVVSSCMFVLVPLFLTGVCIGNPVVLAIFTVVIVILCKYAPADTKAMPLVGEGRRGRFKRMAIVCGVVLMAAALLVPDNSIKLLLALGAAYQSIAILPLTYKILKRSVKNYEVYETA